MLPISEALNMGKLIPLVESVTEDSWGSRCLSWCPGPPDHEPSGCALISSGEFIGKGMPAGAAWDNGYWSVETTKYFLVDKLHKENQSLFTWLLTDKYNSQFGLSPYASNWVLSVFYLLPQIKSIFKRQTFISTEPTGSERASLEELRVRGKGWMCIICCSD